MKKDDFPIELILYKKDPISELKIIYVFENDFDTSDAYEDFLELLKQRCYCVMRYSYGEYYVKV